MWSLALIIGVAVAGSVVLLVTGVILAVSLERRRHRHILQAHGLSRGLSTYHRAKLSANANNYSHVTAPNTYLRRSVQLPYGVVSIGCLESGSVAEEETAVDHTTQLLRTDHGVLQPRGARSIRRSFKGQHLQIPKTRRQKVLQKAISLNQGQNSPLSAITEFTDSPPSKSPAVAEPMSEARKAAPILESSSKEERQASVQWPLIVSKTRSSDATPTEVMSMAARASMLMRMGGAITHRSNPPCPATVPRSVSMTSTTSSAPDDPLPPLPTIDGYKRPRTHDLRSRESNASLDTVGSSVLGAVVGTSSHTTSGVMVTGSEADARFYRLEPYLDGNPAPPRLQVPSVGRAIHGLCTSKPSIHSLHPSFDMDGSSPELFGDRSGSIRRPLPGTVGYDDSFKTIAASLWENPLPLKINKTRSGGTTHARHSMFEPSNTLQWRAASDSMTTKVLHPPTASLGDTIKRPASVATGHPLRWDRQGSFATNRHSLSWLDEPRRGHRRQNCVRITNLPTIDAGLKTMMAKMPELPEERQSADGMVRYESDEMTQSGDRLQRQRDSTLPKGQLTMMAPEPTSIKSSPFRNRPILTPSSRPAPPQYIQPPINVGSGIPRADSGIFNSSYMKPGQFRIYNTSPRQWPLSPSPRDRRQVNGRLSPPSDVYPFDSPTLPSPTLNSSSLYPRRSLVKGPRHPRGAVSSPSPLQGKQGSSFHLTKDEDEDRSSGVGGPGERTVDLRKSVMMLRSMNSEGRLLDQQHNINIKFYRNIGFGVSASTGDDVNPNANDNANDSSPEPVYRLTPPMNKRVSGLRQSSGGSSTKSMGMSMSMSMSPTVHLNRNRKTNIDRNRSIDRDRPFSPGSSPLTQTQSTSISVPRLNLDRPKSGNDRGRSGDSAGSGSDRGDGGGGGDTVGAINTNTLTIPSQHFGSTAISTSPSALSIWEDASVCGESPEPERRSPQISQDRESSLHVTPLVLRIKSNLRNEKTNHKDNRTGDVQEKYQLPQHHRPEQQQAHQQAQRYAYPRSSFTAQSFDDASAPLSLLLSRPRTPNKANPDPSSLRVTSGSIQRLRSGPGPVIYTSIDDVGVDNDSENENKNENEKNNEKSSDSDADTHTDTENNLARTRCSELALNTNTTTNHISDTTSNTNCSSDTKDNTNSYSKTNTNTNMKTTSHTNTNTNSNINNNNNSNFNSKLVQRLERAVTSNHWAELTTIDNSPPWRLSAGFHSHSHSHSHYRPQSASDRDMDRPTRYKSTIDKNSNTGLTGPNSNTGTDSNSGSNGPNTGSHTITGGSKRYTNLNSNIAQLGSTGQRDTNLASTNGCATGWRRQTDININRQTDSNTNSHNNRNIQTQAQIQTQTQTQTDTDTQMHMHTNTNTKHTNTNMSSSRNANQIDSGRHTQRHHHSNHHDNHHHELPQSKGEVGLGLRLGKNGPALLSASYY